MSEIVILKINKEKFNPFGATEEELVANALDEAGLIKNDTLINNAYARALCNSFFDKRDNYKESTKLGNILIKGQLISTEQLQQALVYQRTNPEVKLGRALLNLNICTMEQIEQSLATQSLIREEFQKLDSYIDQIADIRERLEKYF